MAVQAGLKPPAILPNTIRQKMPIFEAIIFHHDRFGLGDWNWIEMPFLAKEIFGSKGNVPVVAVVDGVEFKSNILPAGNDKHTLFISKDLQKKIKKRAGMTVHVSIEIDTIPRLLEMPLDVEDALENNPRAKVFFEETLSPSHRKGLITYVNDAKLVETRLKRIDKLIAAMATWNKLGQKPKSGQSIFKLPEEL